MTVSPEKIADAGPLTGIDRLRLYVHDDDTFGLAIEDAEAALVEHDAILTELVAARSKLDALTAEREWKPIETAPKDGTRILACCAEAQSPRASVTWWEDRWLIQVVPDDFVSGTPRGWFPTHWQPLPKPPGRGDQNG